jgi:hypothetical protein
MQAEHIVANNLAIVSGLTVKLEKSAALAAEHRKMLAQP